MNADIDDDDDRDEDEDLEDEEQATASSPWGTIDAIVEAVNAHDGILTVEMGQLRDAYGAGRLGPNVCQNIRDELAERGVLCQPSKLPESGSARARLYKRQSRVAKIIRAVRAFGEQNDERLRRYAAKNAQEKLDRIIRIIEE